MCTKLPQGKYTCADMKCQQHENVHLDTQLLPRANKLGLSSTWYPQASESPKGQATQISPILGSRWSSWSSQNGTFWIWQKLSSAVIQGMRRHCKQRWTFSCSAITHILLRGVVPQGPWQVPLCGPGAGDPSCTANFDSIHSFFSLILLTSLSLCFITPLSSNSLKTVFWK